MSPHTRVRAADLSKDLRSPTPRARAQPADKGPISLAEAERAAIERAMNATGGNKTQASLKLGISRKQLYVKLKRLQVR